MLHKISFFIVGVLIASTTSIAVAAFKFPEDVEPGSWISDTEQYFTYETLCKGYYIVDYSSKNKIKYTGYGDLDFKYTYEEDIVFYPVISSSTATTTR